ncbi:hypothetical protein ACFFLZ_13935 [Photobacterium aphoticum]|uniref:Uncharacterized protein n=1 Tax=Photobacterium aphoticum TaxID=754436 RepID=A0A0J1GL45_9GAMM|nr:hypothetical protein [Photobacterium aphoticum]KLV00423.1 hypothetical protein ABT58_12200 [Photobacterium aphoticum]PSU59764.1 hypothetical protein C9I90_02025 [Photobacterium aphoticum]GHA42515.1 hypothetical protein GCM10007086_15170 [Photobacterium aphoticum]
MEELPQNKEWKDYGHAGVKATLNVIPLAGGALATLFETVFSAPIDKRKEDWLILLASTVDEVCEKVENLTPEKLSEHDAFISAYLQASNIAVRTHQEEKIKALNNAVKNTVLNNEIDETIKLMFIRFIDEMTPLHFRILHFLSTPDHYIQKLNTNPNSYTHWGDLRNVWEKTYSDVSSNDPIIDLIISDLNRFGMVRIKQFHEARLDSVGTSVGQNFIDFIELES